MKRIAICDDEIGTCSDLEKMILDFAGHHGLRMETEGQNLSDIPLTELT